MKKNQSSYRQIMKATSLFGGVQVFNIIISIIRSKAIAVLLGPTGMGISGLLTSTISMVKVLTNFGLGTSAIKDIAAANESGDKNHIGKIILVFRRLVWGTGLLGAIVTLLFSSYLSQLTFGNKEYTNAFVWLSITLLFNQLTSGQNVLLQGLRKLRLLAKVNIAGSVVGLLVSLPLYYYWEIDGIVPALLITSFFSLLIAWFFARKVKVEKVKITRHQTILEGTGMLKMGFALSLSSLIAIGAAFITRIFISNQGGVNDVGVYSAGFTIIFTYVGLVFSAMGTDYYPRLSSVAHDNKKAANLINEQTEIAVLILAPILLVFIIFIDWTVVLLYSSKFIAASSMIQWAALGMYFRAAAWAIAFLLLAKGVSSLFFWNELVFNIYMLALNILGYYWKGLDGLGISFLIGYFFYLIQVLLLTKHKYQFAFTIDFYKIFCFQFILGLSCFLIIKLVAPPWAYLLGLPFIFISSWYSFKKLDERLDIKELYLAFKSKKNDV